MYKRQGGGRERGLHDLDDEVEHHLLSGRALLGRHFEEFGHGVHVRGFAPEGFLVLGHHRVEIGERLALPLGGERTAFDDQVLDHSAHIIGALAPLNRGLGEELVVPTDLLEQFIQVELLHDAPDDLVENTGERVAPVQGEVDPAQGIARRLSRAHQLPPPIMPLLSISVPS